MPGHLSFTETFAFSVHLQSFHSRALQIYLQFQWQVIISAMLSICRSRRVVHKFHSSEALNYSKDIEKLGNGGQSMKILKTKKKNKAFYVSPTLWGVTEVDWSIFFEVEVKQSNGFSVLFYVLLGNNKEEEWAVEPSCYSKCTYMTPFIIDFHSSDKRNISSNGTLS